MKGVVAWPRPWERPSTCECIARVVSAPTAAFLPGDSSDSSWFSSRTIVPGTVPRVMPDSGRGLLRVWEGVPPKAGEWQAPCLRVSQCEQG